MMPTILPQNTVTLERLTNKARGLEAGAEEVAFVDSAEMYVEKDIAKEEAVKHKRVWVRVTRLCNQRCTFCLDSWNQNGTYVPVQELMAFIKKGRDEGGERLILSGGEASVHPEFIKLIRYGKKLGYEWIQTVTNGQMFAYPEFALKAKLAGLNEATFSMHGHTPRLHDRLVGLPGAFERGNQAIRNLQALGGVVVNVDIVINKMNVAFLRDIIDFYMAMGIREFDLLYIVPFGRGFEEFREQLFFDIEEYHDHLQRAFEVASEPGVFIWTNRLPVAQLEGYEHLIQDPHKLHSEVNGGRNNFEGFMKTGRLPDCHGERCDYCFLNGLCRGNMLDYRARHLDGTFERVAIDLSTPLAGPKAEAALALQRPASVEVRGATAEQVRWALSGGLAEAAERRADVESAAELMELVANPGPYTAIVVRDRDTLARLSTMELPDGLAVEVELDKETAAWLAEGALGSLRSRLTLRLGNHEYLSESRDTDPEAPALRALSLLGVPMKNVPRCLAGEQSRPADHKTLHAEMIDRNGDLDIDRYVHHYITSEYYAKSKRCRGCVFDADCKGMHINYLRNQGFKVLEPVPAASTAAATA
jgi:MoaA/NifB/PqqE/SkfB family radical SAM enzyme